VSTTGRQQRIVAHEYAGVSDPQGKCLNNLAVRLFVTVQAGKEDWKRWAKNTGDQELIDAVNDAVRAIEAAHKKATTALRHKSGKEDQK